MNLTDFVDNIKVSIQDLEYTNQHGYEKGISNIFTKHLTDMAMTKNWLSLKHTKIIKLMRFLIRKEVFDHHFLAEPRAATEYKTTGNRIAENFLKMD